jgi:hypothetical protein
MARDDKPNMDKVFRNKTSAFKEKSYDIYSQGSEEWFRMGGWNKTGLPVAELVATSVFYGWCVEGVLAG